LFEVPTTYDGPDLQRVADHGRLAVKEVIDLHTSVEYLVYCIGFAPGFAYCGSVPEQIACPRLPSPRTRVLAGSVGIAGRQTGVYPVESPGGWNIIGRTSMALFDVRRDPPALLKPGDRIRFVAQ
jgi:KipI family sensor histidine kinase inhibitor